METEFNLNLVVITSHDYMFFASRDYGAVAYPSDIVGNYALMYAVNRGTSGVTRVASGTTPYYDEDMVKMNTYATPGAPTEQFPYQGTGTTSANGGRWLLRETRIGSKTIPSWDAASISRITWNSIGETLLDIMTRDRLNLPKVGAYFKHAPLRSFYFYTIGKDIPQVIRLGKKHTSVRCSVFPLKPKLAFGTFRPTCPVNTIDLPEQTRILQGSILTIPPSPVIVDAELDGAHLSAVDSHGYIHRVPIPDRAKYLRVFGSERQETIHG